MFTAVNIILHWFGIIWHDSIPVTGSSALFIPDASIDVEGKKNIPKTWSLFGSHFSEGFATAVASLYVYHYSLSECQSAHSSMLPTVQISPKGYQIFLCDSLQDVMLANNFFWSRESLIYLWAFFHHHLFFPPNLDSNLKNYVTKFGYGMSSGFYENRSELLFGLSLNSPHWKKTEPEEGRMM